MTNKINTVLKAITDRMAGTLPSDTVKNPKQNVNSTHSVLSARSYRIDDPQCSTQIHSSINTITICPKRSGKSQTGKPEEEKQDEKDKPEYINTNPSSPLDLSVLFITEKDGDFHKEEPEVGENAGIEELEVKYYDVFPTRSELAYHKYLMIKGMHVFVENFTYVIDFMIVEDISSIIDPRLLQVVLGKPFVEISNMTHDPPASVVRFTNGTNEIAYKMPHKIE
uniref:MAK10-like protein n=1 Tax=Tanacetum cinerariifolium TaxID=118510 RepID=A0A6L2MF46_TANCI|nr:MAK10-like protein [Tanacetum cinerariifolium]